MNMSLCQQQKEIKENNLKLKSRTSESAREAESLQIYRRQQQQKKKDLYIASFYIFSQCQQKERL